MFALFSRRLSPTAFAYLPPHGSLQRSILGSTPYRPPHRQRAWDSERKATVEKDRYPYLRFFVAIFVAKGCYDYDRRDRVLASESKVLEVKRLPVDLNKVVGYGRFLIGLSQGSFFAIHRDTGVVEWRTPLGICCLDYCIHEGEVLIVQKGSCDLLRFDAETGDFLGKIELPAPLHGPNDQFYLTPSGIFFLKVFQAKERCLYAGIPSSVGWETVFYKKSVPNGAFKPLGESVCFQQDTGVVCIIDQRGNMERIEGCIDICEKEGTRYTISRSERKGECIVSSSHEERACWIPYASAAFAGVADNGLCLLRLGGRPNHVCFVDLNSDRICYTEREFSARCHVWIDEKALLVWVYDPDERSLSVFSAQGELRPVPCDGHPKEAFAHGRTLYRVRPLA